MRADAAHNAERVLQSTITLLRTEPEASLEEIAAAAGVSRATVYRHFGSRAELVAAARRRADESADANERDALRPAGELAGGPTPLDVTEVLNKVPPHLLGDQIVSEARRLAGVTSVALYLIDLEGTHLLRLAGSEEFPETLDLPLAVGPELPREGLVALRAQIARELPGSVLAPLSLRGRTLGHPARRRRPRARAGGARAPGRRLARAGRRLHRRLRHRPPAQGDQPGGRDPAEPAPAADRAHHGRARGRQRPARLRDRRRLVRLRREPRRRLARRRRQHGPRHDRRRARRRRPRRVPGQAQGHRRPPRGRARHPPDDPRGRRSTARSSTRRSPAGTGRRAPSRGSPAATSGRC